MSTTTTDGCSIENILENDLISREVFAHFSLTDLLNISLVNTAWMNVVRCYIHEHLICDKLPKHPSPCTSLIGLETELESMAIPHYTGIRIYLTRCSAHSEANFRSEDSHLETMFPNILNRLNLKHICLWFGSAKNSEVCGLVVKLVQKLCQKHADSLRKITVILKGCQDSTLLREMFLTGAGYKKVKNLSIDCEWLGEETQEFFLDLIKSSPKLEQVKCPTVDIVPQGWKHLVKELVLDGGKSRDWDPRKFEATFNLEYLMAINCNSQYWSVPWDIFNNLLCSSAESLKILSIRGPEFPQWSTKQNMPVLVNIEKLQVVTSLNDQWFLRELGFICGVVLPRLKVVSVHHSPCIARHITDPYEDQGQIVPNDRVRTLRLTGFDCEMDVIMGEFRKYFPHLTELHLIDCDGSAIQEVFKWKTLECIVFGRRKSYWTENYDRFILGVESEEEMREIRKNLRSGHDLETFTLTGPGLLSLRDLRRVYIMGGACRVVYEEEEQASLSKQVMSLVTKKMPQIAIRILKGYNDSVLTHLLHFDNGAGHPWCPPVPHDVEKYFEYSL